MSCGCSCELWTPRAIYRLDQSISPTEGDVSLVYEALRSFNYLSKLDKFTGKAVGSRTHWKASVKTYFSRLYPYFLWCLYYGSNAETAKAEERVIRFYLDEMKRKIAGTFHPDGHEDFVRKSIAFSWNDLKENQLKKEIMEGKSFFVSQFPPDLQDLAKSFFCFYLNKRIDSWASPLEEFSLIAKDRHVKREFESHFGKKVPKYRLERFLDKLTSTSHHRISSRSRYRTPEAAS
jgi:hypothetical protein